MIFKNLNLYEWGGSKPPLLIKEMQIVNNYNALMESIIEAQEKEDPDLINVECVFKLCELLELKHEFQKHELKQAVILFELYQDDFKAYIDKIYLDIEQINKKYDQPSKVSKSDMSANRILSRIPKDLWNNLKLSGAMSYVRDLDQLNEMNLFRNFLNIAIGTGLHKSKNAQSHVNAYRYTMFDLEDDTSEPTGKRLTAKQVQESFTDGVDEIVVTLEDLNSNN